jgi:uncharacterized protein (DUF488 family)
MQLMYSIGHSTHPLPMFVESLHRYNINVVADIRSMPFTRYASQFNKLPFQAYLKQQNIQYVPLGDELGGKRVEEDVYTNNAVDFSKLSILPLFISGITRLKLGFDKGYTIAIMCSEANPAQCHRFALVTKILKDTYAIDVNHILPNNTVISHSELEQRVITAYTMQRATLNIHDVFSLDAMYTMLNRQVGYKKKTK